MELGLSLSLVRGGAAGEPPIITATVEPTAYAYSDGDAVNTHPSFATLDNTTNYSSTAGTITSVEWLVDGIDQAGTYTLSAGEAVVIRVTDSVANTRDWTIDASVDAVVPAQFNTNHWSLANDGVNITLTVSTLPDDGGSALTDLEYKVNAGSYTSLGAATTGDYTITASEGDSVYLRAVNAVGNGPDSAAKTVPAAGAALDLNFASGTYTDGTNTLLSDIATFSRSGNATMIDSTGTVVWAPHNLYARSEEFDNATWNKTNSSVTANATTDPDGGSTADKFIINNAVSGGYLLQNFSSTAGHTYKCGIWAKAGEYSNLQLAISRFAASSYASFDLVNGVVDQNDTGGTATITADGSYYFCELEVVATTSAADARFLISADDDGTTARLGQVGDGTSGIYIWGVHVYRSDLGGMADNPERSDSYVPTTTAAVYMPRENHYEYSGAAWVNDGILYEPTGATNLLHTTNALVTQNVTTTAQAYTLHFTGTGTVTLSGTSTAGPLVGTGTGENNRVSLTFTPTAGTLTLTVTGTVTNAQLEAGSYQSSYIPNLAGSGTVTRAAETLVINAASMPESATGQSIIIKHKSSYIDDGANHLARGIFNWGSTDFIRLGLGTFSTRTGYPIAGMQNGANLSRANYNSTTDVYSPGYRVAMHLGVRCNSTGYIEVVADGSTLSAPQTVSGAYPTLTGETMELFTHGSKDMNGTIQRIRVWDSDIGQSDLLTETT